LGFEWCRVLLLLLFHFERVSRLMILDLEPQKIMNGPDGVGIGRSDTNFRTSPGVPNQVGDFFVEPFHRLHPGRCRCVDKDRNGKVALGKSLRDHTKMITNGFLAIVVGCVITRDFDRSSVGKEMEMMGRFLMAKAHALISAGIYPGKMIFTARRGLLGHRASQAQRADDEQGKEVKKFHGTQRR
jgi:hypothetical protein